MPGRSDGRHEGRDRRRAARRIEREVARHDHRSLRKRREVKDADERRRDILEAALNLFDTKGFAEATVGDIAAAAGVATGTVYLYFPSKDHVLQSLHDEMLQGLEGKITEAASAAFERTSRGEQPDYRDTINVILDAVTEQAAERAALLRVCARYRPEIHADSRTGPPPHIMLVARALEEGIRLGFIHASDPEMFARLMDGALGEAITNHLLYGDPADLERLIRAAKEMFAKALAPVPSRKPTPRQGRSRPRHSVR